MNFSNNNSSGIYGEKFYNIPLEDDTSYTNKSSVIINEPKCLVPYKDEANQQQQQQQHVVDDEKQEHKQSLCHSMCSGFVKFFQNLISIKNDGISESETKKSFNLNSSKDAEWQKTIQYLLTNEQSKLPQITKIEATMSPRLTPIANDTPNIVTKKLKLIKIASTEKESMLDTSNIDTSDTDLDDEDYSNCFTVTYDDCNPRHQQYMNTISSCVSSCANNKRKIYPNDTFEENIDDDDKKSTTSSELSVFNKLTDVNSGDINIDEVIKQLNVNLSDISTNSLGSFSLDSDDTDVDDVDADDEQDNDDHLALSSESAKIIKKSCFFNTNVHSTAINANNQNFRKVLKVSHSNRKPTCLNDADFSH